MLVLKDLLCTHSIIMSAVHYQRAIAFDEVTNKEAKLEVNLTTPQPHEAVGALKLLHYPAQHLQTASLYFPSFTDPSSR